MYAVLGLTSAYSFCSSFLKIKLKITEVDTHYIHGFIWFMHGTFPIIPRTSVNMIWTLRNVGNHLIFSGWFVWDCEKITFWIAFSGLGLTHDVNRVDTFFFHIKVWKPGNLHLTTGAICRVEEGNISPCIQLLLQLPLQQLFLVFMPSSINLVPEKSYSELAYLVVTWSNSWWQKSCTSWCSRCPSIHRVIGFCTFQVRK